MFAFQQFTIHQDRCAMKVGVDSVLLGAAADLPSFCYHALDIGTGTGLLALMLAQRLPLCDIDAVELNVDAANQAAENVAASPFADRVRVHQGRVQDFRPKQSYDLIICNPPYFTNGVPSSNPARQQARHTDTLSSIDLLTAVTRLLNPTGIFWVILPFDQHISFVRTASAYHLKPSKQVRIHPRPEKPPNRLLLRFERISKQISVEHLNVRDTAGQAFSKQFQQLTSEFYL